MLNEYVLASATFRRRAVTLASAAALSIAAFVAPATAATVEPIETGDAATATLLYSGPVVQGDLERLHKQVEKVPAGKRIVLMLESPGGNLNEGFAVGRFIHSARITTVAIQGKGCHSSCTFMFLGGRDLTSGQPSRIMMKGARIGFHQGHIAGLQQRAYTADDINKATAFGQEMVRSANAFLAEIKADPEFLTLFLSSPAATVTLLNELDALRLGIYVMDPQTRTLLSPDTLKLIPAKL